MMCLVTGAGGFIGSHLVNVLKSYSDYEVVVLLRDYVPKRWVNEALQGCVLVHGDIRSLPLLKRVITDYGVEWVFHLASQAIVKQAALNPLETFDSNIIGTVNVLEACRQLDVKKVLIQSTDKVYGNVLDATEETPLRATEPYSASKVAADVIAQSYMKTYGMGMVIPRSCNVYGLDYSSRIIPNTVRSCLRGEPPIIYEGEKGTARQYIYVDEEVETLIFLMERFDGVVNIPGDYKTQEEVVLEVLKHFPSLEPRYVAREAPKEIQRQSMLGHLGLLEWMVSERGIPKTGFEEGIRRTINRFQLYKEDWW